MTIRIAKKEKDRANASKLPPVVDCARSRKTNWSQSRRIPSA
jgi:hypothetical protein